MIRWLFAAIHLLALGIGLGAVWARAQGLRGTLDVAGLKRVFYADTWWGIAAIFWIGTGLVRAFGNLEKGSAYYVHNEFFRIKMTLLILILALEIAPMVSLIRWRIQVAKGATPDTRAARRFALISTIQAGLVVLMVLCATAMARGYGYAPAVAIDGCWANANRSALSVSLRVVGKPCGAPLYTSRIAPLMVVLAVNDERGDVDFLQVVPEVGFRERLDTVIGAR
jgi:putative membrane protein